jgi:hypothetical protein
MTRCSCVLRHLVLLPWILLTLLGDAARFLWLCRRPPTALAAEDLFLRKQLALYRERGLKPRRASKRLPWSSSVDGLTGGVR